MANNRDIVVLSAVRTAIGTYGGSLAGTPPTQLAATCVKAAVERAGLEPADVGHAAFGNVIHTEPRDMYLARVAAVNGGLPVETPAVTVNRLCGSGLQAIVSAAQLLLLGDAECAVAGGAECMSRGQYWIPGMRFGQRMGDAQVIDAMVGALTDPFDDCHMGITAENVADKWDISREQQDALAVESQQRAARAIEAGYFKDQIVPVEVRQKRETVAFDTDEHVRAQATVESLAKMRPVFKKDGSVTAANASGINDAAAALVLMDGEVAASRGLKPMARLVGYGFAGVEPKYMGIGPVPATRKLLDRLGIGIEDIDVFEVNEAFAAQALAVAKDLDLPPEKTNPNGSGISLGHPIGATGAIISVKAIHELQRTGGRYALVTMCIGGGQGIAAVFERL
ncbi:MAG: acetyl-CoA C-acyltransferase family protein [Chromatiales bacterium]|jgi:acetyl-CoA C-acetyltransferase|nr:acetyl-CoA C-acyltransferase family protein [Chromatiales bacterium]